VVGFVLGRMNVPPSVGLPETQPARLTSIRTVPR
jgi:hypothetical protein